MKANGEQSLLINTVFRLEILEYLSRRSDYLKIIFKFSFWASEKRFSLAFAPRKAILMMASFDCIFQNPSLFLFLMLIRAIVF